jgi:hypothetical protein
MESQGLSPGKFARNYGLMLGLALVLIAVIMYATGMQLEGVKWPMYLFYILFPIVIIYAIGQYKKQNGNLLSLSEALKVGLATAIVSALVYAIYGLLFNYVIDPEFIGLAIEAEMDRMMENPNMTEEMLEQSKKMIEMFSNPLVGTTLWIALSAIFGLIYSLIGGLIMKKEA